MYNFPFFRLTFPNFYPPFYNNYTKKNYYKLNRPIDGSHEQRDNVYEQNNKYKKIPPKYNSFSPFNFIDNVLNGNTNDPIFEIFGIKLYLDDIIILGLLFILYKEGVKDEMLFLSLILLLLT